MFACDVCGKEYRYKRGLRRHKKFECGQDPKYQCPQCPYKTKHNSSLKTHIAKKHSDSESQAAAKTSSTNFIGWSPLQNHAGTFACDGCGKEYQYKRNLDRHKKFECGQEPRYQCPHCPHRAKHKANLKTHIAVKHF
ncbi:hypothetical protein M8J75_013921 [Diaphorina citri]|nr:hypothetical protein M8J75_013921 [Diaphorina citri]